MTRMRGQPRRIAETTRLVSDEALAIIEDQQRIAGAQVADQRFERIARIGTRDAENLRDG